MVSMAFRRSICLVAWCVLSTTAFGQGTSDPLDVALTLSGSVTAERGKENSNFFISSNSAAVAVITKTEYALSADTMSHDWAQRLTGAQTMSLVIGDVRDEMKASKALNEVIMCFTDPAPERKADEVSYLLQCVAWDQTRTVKKDGTPVVELAVIVEVKPGTPADVYLGKPRPPNSFVYLRLQN
jgi:hypothetical protein